MQVSLTRKNIIYLIIGSIFVTLMITLPIVLLKDKKTTPKPTIPPIYFIAYSEKNLQGDEVAYGKYNLAAIISEGRYKIYRVGSSSYNYVIVRTARELSYSLGNTKSFSVPEGFKLHLDFDERTYTYNSGIVNLSDTFEITTDYYSGYNRITKITDLDGNELRLKALLIEQIDKSNRR